MLPSLAKPDPSARREGLVRSLCHVLYRWNVCGDITHHEYDYVKLCMFVIAVKGVATTAMEPYSPPVLRQFVKQKRYACKAKAFPISRWEYSKHTTKLLIAQASGRDN